MPEYLFVSKPMYSQLSVGPWIWCVLYFYKKEKKILLKCNNKRQIRFHLCHLRFTCPWDKNIFIFKLNEGNSSIQLFNSHTSINRKQIRFQVKTKISKKIRFYIIIMPYILNYIWYMTTRVSWWKWFRLSSCKISIFYVARFQ